MTNLMCCSIIRALVRKVNEFIEYYVPMYKRMPHHMSTYTPLPHTSGVYGCKMQQLAKEENSYTDEETQTLYLQTSGMSFPLGSDVANKFMMHLRYGCGEAGCDACKKANAHG